MQRIFFFHLEINPNFNGVRMEKFIKSAHDKVEKFAINAILFIMNLQKMQKVV